MKNLKFVGNAHVRKLTKEDQEKLGVRSPSEDLVWDRRTGGVLEVTDELAAIIAETPTLKDKFEEVSDSSAEQLQMAGTDQSDDTSKSTNDDSKANKSSKKS